MGRIFFSKNAESSAVPSKATAGAAKPKEKISPNRVERMVVTVPGHQLQ
jgi:hypothetical protein